MVTNVTSLLKTVKAVEDEHTRGTRALESSIEAISQEIRAINNTDGLRNNFTLDDLVRCTKSITVSTAKTVSAGNSCKQDDIIAAANIGRRSISDMLVICKSAVQNYAEAEGMKERILQAGHDIAFNYKELLKIVLQISTRSNECKQLLLPVSRKIAQGVTELVTVAEILKGNDWEDADDPTVIAENELLGAAASIDAAAKKLAGLRPRKNIQETKEEMNFDEMILEAAKSIAAATSALIKAASAAQRELIVSGKVSRTPLTSSDDGQWSEGLISAARMVAAATHSLVESANALVQGFSSEEKLISSAKQVASSTAQLLVACKVKADADSDSTKRLQAAGNAVKRATDNLVRATQQAIQHEEERSLVLNRRIVGGIAQEINARSEVLRIERELEEARGRLTAIRQAKYRNRNDTCDTDIEACQEIYDIPLHNETTETKFPDVEYINVHSSNQFRNIAENMSHNKSLKENLISPDKVNFTQNTLQNKKKNLISAEFIDNSCKSLTYYPFYAHDDKFEIIYNDSSSQECLFEKENEKFVSNLESARIKSMDKDYDSINQSSVLPKLNSGKVYQKMHESTQNRNKHMEDKILESCALSINKDQHNNSNNDSCAHLSNTAQINLGANENILNADSIQKYQNAAVSENYSTLSKYALVNETAENISHTNPPTLQSLDNEVLHQTVSKQTTVQKVVEKKTITKSTSNQRINNKLVLNFQTDS